MNQRVKLGEIVLRAGVIDELQLKSALGQQDKWGGRLGVVLVRMGFVTELELVNAVASQLNLPVAKLDGKKIPRKILDLIPYEYADDHTCLPLFLKNEEGRDTLYVGLDDPSNLDILDDLSFRTGLQVKPVVVAASEICEGIDRFYRDLEPEDRENEDADEEKSSAPEVEAEPPVRSRDTSLFAAEPSPETTDPGDTTLSLLDQVVGIEKLLVEESEQAPDRRRVEANDETSTHTLLRALTQILIEKGVLTREEFQQRILALRSEGKSNHN